MIPFLERGRPRPRRRGKPRRGRRGSKRSELLARRRAACCAAADLFADQWLFRARATATVLPAMPEEPGFRDVGVEVRRQVAALAGDGLEREPADLLAFAVQGAHLGGSERS